MRVPARRMAETAPLVEALIEDPRWDAAGLEALAERAARAALEAEGLDPSTRAISLLCCDDARIAALNADFRGKPEATNVLSWPARAGGSRHAGRARSIWAIWRCHTTPARARPRMRGCR